MHYKGLCVYPLSEATLDQRSKNMVPTRCQQIKQRVQHRIKTEQNRSGEVQMLGKQLDGLKLGREASVEIEVFGNLNSC